MEYKCNRIQGLNLDGLGSAAFVLHRFFLKLDYVLGILH